MINALVHYDVLVFTIINSHHTPLLDRLFLIITQFGSGWVAVPLVAIFIIVKTPRKFLARTLLCAAMVGTLSGVLNTQLKNFVHRDRPVLYFTGRPAQSPEVNRSVHVVGELLQRNSFPSGHTNTAFTAAAILALLYGSYFILGWPGALLIGYSRIYVGAHFPLDTLAGAVMGSLIAVLVIALFRSKKWLPLSQFDRRKHAEQ